MKTPKRGSAKPYWLLAFRSDLAKSCHASIASFTAHTIDQLTPLTARANTTNRARCFFFFLTSSGLPKIHFQHPTAQIRVDAARALRSILFYDNVLCSTSVVCRHAFPQYMSPGIHLALGRDRRRGIKNGDRTDRKILDSTTTDMETSAEDWILREVPKLLMTALEVHHQSQELAHRRPLDLAVEAHHQDQNSES